MREYAEAAEAAFRNVRKLAGAVRDLCGTEGVITIRFEVNDQAVTGHPLLNDAAMAEAVLIAGAAAGPLGEGNGANHS